MAHPRTPKEKADITGQSQKNKKRYENRSPPKAVSTLGEPSEFLKDGTQREAWEAFKKELPWLKESDRGLVELASVLRASFWESPIDFGVNRMNQLRMIYSSMGGSPADLSKVYSSDDEDNQDPLGEFIN